jgi:hypothetical protein
LGQVRKKVLLVTDPASEYEPETRMIRAIVVFSAVMIACLMLLGIAGLLK